ncbi:MAG: Ni/Fe hydrogenase subunit delta [Acidobacteria bacterium]|nr:MAG: Ni/Fe hydrogenase subunit delta [Acidobacteriota bacterium]
MKVGVFKFSSCDGCQLAFFELERELLELSERFQIEYFLEASSENRWERFDIAFVEGSISTHDEEERIVRIRESSKYLVAIGACAVSGGIQSARNYENFEELFRRVYEKPLGYGISRLSRPLSDFVKVDLEVRGCPISKDALREILLSHLYNKSPNLPSYPLCLECKRKLNTCVVVAHRQVCLGPITVAGCGALCPSYGRGCYGCYGPVEKPNLEALLEGYKGLMPSENIKELLRLGFNAYNPNIRVML